MLKLINIHKSFNNSAQPILHALNLEIAAGDFCVVLGSNGSGKSTLLRAISGEHSIDQGSIFVNGVDLSNQSRSHIIASVIQDINKSTVPELTMLENMVLSIMRGRNAKLKGYNAYRATMMQHLQLLGTGLEQFIDQPLSLLSGGQRQSIATLMAIISEPAILLLDEHTSALDPHTQQILMQYTAERIGACNITTLMITHKLEDALQYGNRLIMLHQGKITLDLKGVKKHRLSRQDLEVRYAS